MLPVTQARKGFNLSSPLVWSVNKSCDLCHWIIPLLGPFLHLSILLASLAAQTRKRLPAVWETWV